MIRVLVIQLCLWFAAGLSPNGTVEIKIGCNLTPSASVWTVRQRIAQLNQKTDLISPKAVLKLVYYNNTNSNVKVLQDSQNIVKDGAIAVISAGSSARTVLGSYVFQTKNVIQCCGASVSTDLSNDNYSGTAVLEFLKAQGWAYFALVFVKDSQGIASAAYIVTTAKAYNMTVLTQVGIEVDASDADIYAGLGRILDFDARIIIYIGSASVYYQTFTQAKLLGIYGPGYAWIGYAGINKPLVKVPECAGTIYISPIERVANPVTDEFESQYQQDPTSATNLTYSPDVGLNIAQYGYFYATCLDVILYGFDRYLKADKTRTVEALANGTYSKSFKVPDTFNNLTIDTPSGKVILDKNGDRAGAYSFFYIDNTGNGVEMGYVDPTYIPKTNTIYYPGYVTQKPVDFIRPLDIASFADPNTWVGRLLYAFFVISIFVCVSSLVVTVYMNRNKLRATGVDVKLFSHLCLIAACFQFLVMVGLPNDFKCDVDAVLLSFSFTAFHSSILIFNYRIFSIFNNVGSSLKRVSFTMSPLLITFFYTIPALIIGIVWLAIDGPTGVLVRVSNLSYYWTCTSTARNQQIFLDITVIYQAIILGLNVFLAIRCSHIESSTKFVQSTSRVIMFNTSLAIIATIITFVPGSSFQIKLLVKALALFLIIVYDIYEMFIVSHFKLIVAGKTSVITGSRTKGSQTGQSSQSETNKPNDFNSNLKQSFTEKFALVKYRSLGGWKSLMGEQRLYVLAAGTKSCAYLFNVVNRGVDREDLALGDIGFCYNALFVKNFKCDVFGENTLQLQIGKDSFELQFTEPKEMSYWKIYFLSWKQGTAVSSILNE